MKTFKISSLLVLAAFLCMETGCTTLRRSNASGYDRDPQAFGRDLASDRERSVGLSRVEAALEGRREREQYFKNKPYMRNDRDRLEFLSLDSFDERTDWLAAHGVSGSTTPNSREIQALVDINDVTVGMTKQAVRDSWGEPEIVEVAGNPLYGNERWAYTEQLPSTDGFHTERRTVYFEGGRVIGWDRR